MRIEKIEELAQVLKQLGFSKRLPSNNPCGARATLHSSCIKV